MKPPMMHILTLCVVLLLLVACTITSSAQSTTSSTNSVVRQTTPQMRPSDRMFYWYEEARELHSMATHREQEAELVLKKQPGPTTDEFVKQMRLFAHRLQEAAEYADAKAQEAKREISRDMINQHLRCGDTYRRSASKLQTTVKQLVRLRQLKTYWEKLMVV